MGLPHMGLTKIYKSGYGPDEPAKKTLLFINHIPLNYYLIKLIYILITWDQVMLVQLAAHIFVLVARKLF